VNQRPQFQDVDAWGLTHPGHVRTENQDHFFVGSLIRGISVEGTSVTEDDQPVLHPERLASLGMVADGVGSLAGGGEAARLAVRGLVASVARFFYAADQAEREDPEVFSRLLHDAALACHESLLQKGEREGGRRFATTLTLFLGLWPHAYLLQVGDSRCYVYRDRRLTQITRDQTLAQELVESGVLTRTAAEGSRWSNVLYSAIGGSEAAPVVTRVVREWGTVVLLCSDGLTKHVTEARIAERLESMRSSREVAEQLLQDALDGGGTDNITIVVGRTLPPQAPG
jgi:serine/threonine protein phosphatase PrpC